MVRGLPITAERSERIKQSIIDYLRTTPGGTIAAACKTLGHPVSTVYDLRDVDDKFKLELLAARQDADEQGGDVAETALMNAIISNNMTGIIFYLKTKHKHRGYIERKEITGKDGVPLKSGPIEDLPDDALSGAYTDMMKAGDD
jgi:hypothetical protein